MKTRGWEGWFIASFLADTAAALFGTIAASAYSLRRLPGGVADVARRFLFKLPSGSGGLRILMMGIQS
jgi:hypothetical protein